MAKTLSLFEEDRLTLPKSIELSVESLRHYGSFYKHWAIAFSGGKFFYRTPNLIDELVVQLIYKLSRRRMSGLKLWTKCKLLKPLDQFGVEKRTKIGLQAWCKQCFNEHKRNYRAANKEKDREYQKKRRQENPERERIRLQRWREANPEKFREQAKRQHEANREKRNASARVRTQQHYKLNREAYYAHTHKRRARKKLSGGSYTAAEWEALKTRYSYTCLCCQQMEPNIKLTPDHVIPLSQGGRNDIQNIQPLCLTCNLRKHTKSIDYRIEE